MILGQQRLEGGEEWTNVEGGESSMVDANGFVYLRERYYDPVTGRFPNLDPLEGTMEQPMSLNRYSYVQNNPVNLVDPSGMIAERPELWASCVDKLPSINVPFAGHGGGRYGPFIPSRGIPNKPALDMPCLGAPGYSKGMWYFFATGSCAYPLVAWVAWTVDGPATTRIDTQIAGFRSDLFGQQEYAQNWDPGPLHTCMGEACSGFLGIDPPDPQLTGYSEVSIQTAALCTDGKREIFVGGCGTEQSRRNAAILWNLITSAEIVPNPPGIPPVAPPNSN